MLPLLMNLKAIWGIVKAAGQSWIKDNAARLGAALSYYTIFALPPLFVIVIFIGSLWLDERAVQSGLLEEVGGLIGKQGARAIQSTLSATNPQSTGLMASIIAIGTLILTATGLFIELQNDLNWVVSFGVITVLFAMIFKVLPDVRIAWRDVWIGAGLTSLLFTAGKTLLGLYLGRNSTVTAYGAAGSLVLTDHAVRHHRPRVHSGAGDFQHLERKRHPRQHPVAEPGWIDN